MRRRWFALAVLAIVLVSASLRAYGLDSNPPELFEDELSGVVSVWSIATTGHDVGRTVLPFLTTGLELKQPMYFVATVPFQAVFGHGTLAVRIPAVLFGVLTTLLIVWLLLLLHAGRRVALIGGALFAISPWAIHYARAAWEPAAYLPFAVAGIGLLWLGLRDHRRRATIGAAVVLAFGAYTYHPALLMAVVMALTVVVILHRTLRRPDLINLLAGAAIAAVILIPYGLALSDPLFLHRTAALSVFRDGITPEALQLGWSNYWAQWSPAYLIGGVAPNPRINPGILVDAWTLPFLVMGLDRLLHRRRREDLLLLAWLVLGALPAALTDDRTTPHAARGLLVAPALVAITAIGVGRALAWVRTHGRGKRWQPLPIIAVVVIATLGTVSFYRTYQTDYIVRSASWWGYGSGEALRTAGAVVPAGGQLCIATNDISGFTFTQQVMYHLPVRAYTITKGLTAPVCSQRGTILLAFASRDLGLTVEELATIPDIRGKPLFRVVRVVGPPAGG
jgi:4-amino-4-deoxy-L-arabinose transferase-like glycosyltransferase